MIAAGIECVLRNFPGILTALALIIPTLRRRPAPAAERYLAWLLLLAVGADALWAGFFHVFFPEIARQSIGWGASPFQLEVGVADIALGVVAMASFRRSLSFQSAIALYAIVFYAGVIIGHVQQAVVADNFAPNNFGALLGITVLRLVLLVVLLRAAWRGREAR